MKPSLMKKERDRLSLSLLFVTILCVTIGFLPQRNWYVDPETNHHVTEWTLGFRFSPLWKYINSEAPDGSFVWKAGIEFPSWSWVPFTAGAVCFELWSRRRRKSVDLTQQSELQTSHID